MAKEYRCLRALKAIMGSLGSLPQGLPAPLPRTPFQPSQAVRCLMPRTGAALVALAAPGWWVGWTQASRAWSNALGRPWWSGPPGKRWGGLTRPVTYGEHLCTSLESSLIFVLRHPTDGAQQPLLWEQVWKYQTLLTIHYSQDANIIYVMFCDHCDIIMLNIWNDNCEK